MGAFDVALVFGEDIDDLVGDPEPLRSGFSGEPVRSAWAGRRHTVRTFTSTDSATSRT
ncbi:hypothetical protein [Embleya sp. NBC_00896]|uniref:hypothetical protein n=1 Tax=Embleya sp. NBC_00896 TaxID=2975961 RepID=UPI0038683DD6|nr:hypothetical protein OG928_44795 [Embleya sp. NBC_00896]